MSGELEVAVGLATRTGRRRDNQDFVLCTFGTASERRSHGVAAALADGVGGAAGGRVAAELACRSFLEGYYAQAPTFGIAQRASRAIEPYNAWLHAMTACDASLAGAATTFAGLIVHGRRAHAVHAGDSRIWHFRSGVLSCLTRDHTLAQPDLAHVLTRAIGAEPAIRLDHRIQELMPDDRLLLTSDGVHGTLSDRALARMLGARASAAHDAEAIVTAALAAGSNDNASAIVLDIVQLPGLDRDALAADAASLPLGKLPKEGDAIDGFRLGRRIADGRTTRLFLAFDADGRRLALKFPKDLIQSEPGARAAFMRECAVGAAVRSPYLGETLPLSPGRQSLLYVALAFHDGVTLATRLARGTMSIEAGIALAARLARGVAALHRRRIVHRDIKPDNVILTDDGGVRLIDFGAARLPELDAELENDGPVPGTPGFMAPELYDGHRGDAFSDQFALGVTFYRIFTGGAPYGEIEPFARPRFDRAADPVKRRPEIPDWLARMLTRMVAARPEARFESVEEIVELLETGSARPLVPARARPLIERDPLRFWQATALLLAALLLLTLALRR